jgi:hypothetical protein
MQEKFQNLVAPNLRLRKLALVSEYGPCIFPWSTRQISFSVVHTANVFFRGPHGKCLFPWSTRQMEYLHSAKYYRDAVLHDTYFCRTTNSCRVGLCKWTLREKPKAGSLDG